MRKEYEYVMGKENTIGKENTTDKEYKLSNGMVIPALGFGTYNPGGDNHKEMIATAIKVGFRYFDTASIYGTEQALGEAVKESGIPRSEFILASKAWIDEMGYEEVKEALQRTLHRLDTPYLDIYLIHWPRAAEDEGWQQRIADTYRALEEAYEEGLIRGIGLSNFLPHHGDALMASCRVKPVLNQLELHPGYMQHSAVEYWKKHGVLLQAWSPLGRRALMEEPLMISLSSKYGLSVPQLCLRYLVQSGIAPVVKSSSEERMLQNMDIYDFNISEEDMWMISCMPQTAWSGEHPDFAIPTVKSQKQDITMP